MRKINPREVIGHKNENRCKKNGCKPSPTHGYWNTSYCMNCKRPMKSGDLKKKI